MIRSLPHYHKTQRSSFSNIPKQRNTMFISEIPVRLGAEKKISWVANLQENTSVQDILSSLLSKEDVCRNALYLIVDRQRQLLDLSAKIYDIVAEYNKKPCARRLLFEIRRTVEKKRVRFADEIISESIRAREGLKLKSKPATMNEKLEKLKENFQKHVQQQQESYKKKISKRSKLSAAKKNVIEQVHVQHATIKSISRSSSDSGFSSSSSNENLAVLATLV